MRDRSKEFAMLEDTLKILKQGRYEKMVISSRNVECLW